MLTAGQVVLGNKIDVEENKRVVGSDINHQKYHGSDKAFRFPRSVR